MKKWLRKKWRKFLYLILLKISKNKTLTKIYGRLWLQIHKFKIIGIYEYFILPIKRKLVFKKII